MRMNGGCFFFIFFFFFSTNAYFKTWDTSTDGDDGRWVRAQGTICLEPSGMFLFFLILLQIPRPPQRPPQSPFPPLRRIQRPPPHLDASNRYRNGGGSSRGGARRLATATYPNDDEWARDVPLVYGFFFSFFFSTNAYLHLN